MVNRRRKSFAEAHALLGELRELHPAIRDNVYATPRQLQPLKSLQKLLVKEIIRAERKLRRSKAMLKTLDPAQAPEAIILLEERIEIYHHLAYIWRCFGDAVAFLFMDKFALKQAFFNTHNLSAKQDAGFLTDKEGLSVEWRVMEGFIARGIPALLNDLTNTIRHGDVCVMIGPDPHLIEVKSGKLDSRGRRQRESIRQIMKFLETDETDALRGLGKLRRAEHVTSEMVYTDVMNECIAVATKNGKAWRSPEDGLCYIAIEEGSVEDILAEFKFTRPAVFLLNGFKAQRIWSPYSPFTLSICDREALFKFIWGDICLAVIYDLDALRRMAESQGLKIDFPSPEMDYAFELARAGVSGHIRLSNQMFSRLAFEFTSPTWLFHETVKSLDRHSTATINEDAVGDESSFN